MPGNITTLGEGAFGYSGLASVKIPDSITSVDMFTFYACENLDSVTFGKGLTETAYEMFEGCVNLTTINFGSKLAYLDARTFANCTSLTNVTLPANITTISNGTFGNCYNLESFTSKGLKAIPFQAFLNCEKLTTVTLNEGVTIIHRCSFLGCDALKKIVVPASVTLVHTDAFEESTTIECKNKDLTPYGSHGYRRQNTVTISGTRDYAKAYEVLALVNKERANAGLSALTMDKELLEAAMVRATETTVLFSHTRPDGSSCFSVIKTKYSSLGENLAMGHKTAKQVMEGWMNSEGHKSNIVSEKYTSMAVACYRENGKLYWAAFFAGRKL